MTGSGTQPYGSILTRKGIIALKPLGFGDFFDGAFRAIRHNPRAMIGLSALVVGVTNVLVSLPLAGLVSSPAFTDPTASTEISDAQAVGLLGGVLALIPLLFLQSIAFVVLTGMLILSVTQSVVDRKLSIGELWTRARGRVWALIGWSLLTSVAFSLLLALALAPGITLLVLEEFIGGAVALVVLVLAFLALVVWLYVKLAFVPVLLVVERLGIGASMRRSFGLVRGAFWKTLGILLLTSLLTGVVSQTLSAPFVLLGTVALTLLGTQPVLGAAIYVVTTALGSTLAIVLVLPFLAAVVALLYIDRRIRLEGLDVALARSLEDRTA